jgi:nucleotide-binding universal stress UspA family protein
MSYKIILVQVDDSKNLEPRIAIAADIAAAENAHMIGVAVTGVSRLLHETLSIAHDNPIIEPHVRTLRQHAANALKQFETIAGQMGVVSVEKRLVDDEIIGGTSLQARCCDLVVLGQPDPDESSSVINPSFPEHVVMNSGVPVLIIPFVSTSRKVGDKALIAWNGSVEATRAVHHAVPMLKRARTVKVAILNPASQPEIIDDPPGACLVRYLARHNIDADVVTATADGKVGDALLQLAAVEASDYLVMGCYGHSRFREVLLGGVTANVLISTPVPVLMSH